MNHAAINTPFQSSSRLSDFALGKLLVAIVLPLTCSCVTSGLKQIGIPYLSVPDALVERHSDADASVLAQVQQIESKCITKQQHYEDQRAKALDKEGTIKTIVGVVTGAVATIGAGSTTISAVADDTSSSSRTAWIAGITAGLSAAGTATIAIITPGKQELELSEKRLETIKQKKEQFNTFLQQDPDPGAWSPAKAAQYRSLLGQLEGLCAN